MMYMAQGIAMQTVFGDGSAHKTPQDQSGGLFDKMLGAGKRLITGESLFITVFTYQGQGKGRVAFAAPIQGRSFPWTSRTTRANSSVRNRVYLCAAKGVALDVAFQKRIRQLPFIGGRDLSCRRLNLAMVLGL